MKVVRLMKIPDFIEDPSTYTPYNNSQIIELVKRFYELFNDENFFIGMFYNDTGSFVIDARHFDDGTIALIEKGGHYETSDIIITETKEVKQYLENINNDYYFIIKEHTPSYNLTNNKEEVWGVVRFIISTTKNTAKGSMREATFI